MNKYLLILCFFNILWAGTLPIYKTLSETLPVGVIVTIRFGLAGVLMIPFWKSFKGDMPKGTNLVKTFIMGVLVFCLGHRFQVAGNNYGGAGNSAVLMALEPLLASVMAAIFLKESIPTKRWAGFLLGMLGVAILNGVWKEDFKWTGLGASMLFIASLLCETAYSIIGKPITAKADSGKILCIALLGGTAVNLVFDYGNVVKVIPTLPVKYWLMFAYLSIICTVTGYLIWLNTVKKLDVNIVALTIFIQPIAGVPMAAFFLNEPLRWEQFWGAVVIASGLFIGFKLNNNNHKQK